MKNKFKLVISVLIVLASIFLCQQIIATSISNQQVKIDASDIHHVKYGLFSIDQWKQQLSKIVSNEIANINFDKSSEKELKELVGVQLGILMDKVAERMKRVNNKTTGGWLKQSFIDGVVDMKEIKAGIPEYADAMVKELTKTRNEKKIKDMVGKKVTEYMDKSFDTYDKSEMQAILDRSKSVDIESAKKKLDKTVKDNQRYIFQLSMMMIGLAVLLFAMSAIGRKPLERLEYILLLICLTILLITGVTTPMIDLEAKISMMSFMLMDHAIKFENQVLFFQSKSILDVFWVMITHKDLEMKLVGLLLVTFSVIFPLTKMTCSLVYYYDWCQARKKKLIQFFVLKSGKWSMADVMVVAIFMAYIGFSGIVTSQLNTLSEAMPDLDLLTTNGTSLQPGYYLFLTYTLLAMFLTIFLTRDDCKTDLQDT